MRQFLIAAVEQRIVEVRMQDAVLQVIEDDGP